MIPQNNLSILYVEDDNNLRDRYTQLLKLYFQNVYEASNGEEAMEKYTLYKPDVAILDINIPQINGLKVAKKIREDNENIVLIMLTAYSDREKLLEAIELRLTKYLIKPIKTFELEDILIETISKLKMIQKSKNMLPLNCGFQWDKETKQLYSKDNQRIKLTKKELLLIELFCENKDKTFSNEDILNYVWVDDEDEYNPNKLRIIFSKLKTKLSCNLFDSTYNVGYKLKRNF
ncbi:MAG: response regulator transcription factor [Arcobacteraceae bacterium]|nr:response regulator transcription factor [Arcobacteraceae bacterium]